MTSASAPIPPIAVGVDLVERSRALRTFERFGERFLRRVFTPLEIAQAQGQPARLIGRFVAKEATSKALGTGIGKVSWQDIEIVRQDGGKPLLRLTGAAAARAAELRLVAFDLSISDTHGHVMAVVVGVGAGA